MNVGDMVKFRNGEICTIKQVRIIQKDYKTIDTNFAVKSVKAGKTTYVLEFDDGEITLAGKNEFEPIV